MKWYKRDPDAALSGMAELTFEECGAYNRLLDLLYSRDGDVPDDDKFLSRIFRCNPRTWRALKSRLIAYGKIRSVDGKLTANRVEKTLNEARITTERMSNRSKKRWQINGHAYASPQRQPDPDKYSSFPTAARDCRRKKGIWE